MGIILAKPLTAVEDIYILESEQEKYRQELQSYDLEMNKLLLEIAEMEIIMEKAKEGEKKNLQEDFEEKVTFISIQNAKGNRLATLCQMKRENLEKQLKMLKMQQEQSTIFVNMYKEIQENIHAISEHIRGENVNEAAIDLDIPDSEAVMNQKRSRKEIKEAILGPQDDDENPSEFMKLEENALEKLKEKIKQNQTSNLSFFDKFKLIFK